MKENMVRKVTADNTNKQTKNKLKKTAELCQVLSIINSKYVSKI